MDAYVLYPAFRIRNNGGDFFYCDLCHQPEQTKEHNIRIKTCRTIPHTKLSSNFHSNTPTPRKQTDKQGDHDMKTVLDGLKDDPTGQALGDVKSLRSLVDTAGPGFHVLQESRR